MTSNVKKISELRTNPSIFGLALIKLGGSATKQQINEFTDANGWDRIYPPDLAHYLRKRGWNIKYNYKTQMYVLKNLDEVNDLKTV